MNHAFTASLMVAMLTLGSEGFSIAQAQTEAASSEKLTEAVQKPDVFPIYLQCDVKQSMSAHGKDGTNSIYVDRPSSFSVKVSKTNRPSSVLEEVSGLSATINDGGEGHYVGGFADYTKGIGSRHDVVQLSDIELKIQSFIGLGTTESKNFSMTRTEYSIDRVSGKASKTVRIDYYLGDQYPDHDELVLAEGNCRVAGKKF